MPVEAGRQSDYVIASVGGGSNAMGIFHPYISHQDVKLIGVEAAGEGLDTGRHAASLSAGHVGVLHGNRTYVMQDENGQVQETHSIRSEEHTSELQSLMRISYAVFCLTKKKTNQTNSTYKQHTNKHTSQYH